MIKRIDWKKEGIKRSTKVRRAPDKRNAMNRLPSKYAIGGHVRNLDILTL